MKNIDKGFKSQDENPIVGFIMIIMIVVIFGYLLCN